MCVLSIFKIIDMIWKLVSLTNTDGMNGLFIRMKRHMSASAHSEDWGWFPSLLDRAQKKGYVVNYLYTKIITLILRFCAFQLIESGFLAQVSISPSGQMSDRWPQCTLGLEDEIGYYWIDRAISHIPRVWAWAYAQMRKITAEQSECSRVHTIYRGLRIDHGGEHASQPCCLLTAPAQYRIYVSF